jgi:hypothetical protein
MDLGGEWGNSPCALGCQRCWQRDGAPYPTAAKCRNEESPAVGRGSKLHQAVGCVTTIADRSQSQC